MVGKEVNSSFVPLSKFGANRQKMLRKPPQVIYANRCGAFKTKFLE